MFEKSSQNSRLITPLAFLAVAILCVLVYANGLSGPFLFDDHAHITKNPQVHITTLSPESLSQAWNSSLSPPPSKRQLAQLTFGVNHVFSGLSSHAFKTTNLIIHLLNGWLIFLLSRSLLTAHLLSRHISVTNQRIEWFALAVSAIWLLHPLNLTPVLYVVQRMTQLSTLFVLIGLWLYVSGRLAIAKRLPGLTRVILAFPIALCGFLAKENAVLFPVLLLVFEFTLLRDLPKQENKRTLISIVLVGAVLPSVGGLIYLVTHPELYPYTGRPFSMEERLLTQARALWFYLHMFVTPFLQDLSLFHDDFSISKSWLNPISTAPAIVAWAALLIGSLAYAKRIPVIAFGVLFYLASHSLESSIIPLEMVFEHRNYLPLFGPAFMLAYFLFYPPVKTQARSALPILAVLLTLSYAWVTHVRAVDWSSNESLIISEVEHHPDSLRSNFKAAQHFITLLDNSKLAPSAYAAARIHLEKITSLDKRNPNALFGLIVLNLHIGKQPEPAWIDDLSFELANNAVDATRFSPSQFSFLVRWHLGGNTPLLPTTMTRLFDAIVSNPKLEGRGRAGILATRAIYVERVMKQPEKALPHAEGAVKYWPTRWHYRKRYTQLLVRLGHWQEAEKILGQGIRRGLADNQLAEARLMLEQVQQRKPLPSDIKN